MLENPDFPTKPDKFFALLCDPTFALTLVDFVLLDPPPQGSLAIPGSSATFGIDFSEER